MPATTSAALDAELDRLRSHTGRVARVVGNRLGAAHPWEERYLATGDTIVIAGACLSRDGAPSYYFDCDPSMDRNCVLGANRQVMLPEDVELTTEGPLPKRSPKSRSSSCS